MATVRKSLINQLFLWRRRWLRYEPAETPAMERKTTEGESACWRHKNSRAISVVPHTSRRRVPESSTCRLSLRRL